MLIDSAPASETVPVAGTIPTRTDTANRRASELPRKAALGLVAVAITTLPILRPSGPGNSAPADVLIVLAVSATALAVASARDPVRLPYVVPVSLLITAGAVGAMVNEPTTSAVVALGQDLLLFLFAAAIVNAARTPQAVGALLRVWAISSTVWAAVLVMAVLLGANGLAGISARTGTRASLTFGDANLAANYFVISLLVVAAARIPRRRLVRWGSYALLTTAIVLTGSLGGMLSLLVAVSLLFAYTIARRVGTMGAIAIVLVVCPIWFVGVRSAYEALTAAAQDPGSFFHDSFGRVGSSSGSHDLILAEDLRLFSRASLLGEGPTSTKQTLKREQLLYVKEAHDDYLATGIERGALGMLGLVALAGAVALRGRRALQRSRDALLARAVPNSAALVAALAAVACSAVFYEVLHFRQVWALLALVAAIGLAGEP
jgi:uncharacterized membrane protein YgdD (TMEM256/DUF423 family)